MSNKEHGFQPIDVSIPLQADMLSLPKDCKNPLPEAMSTVQNFKNDFLQLEREIAKAIVGQKEIVRHVLCAMVAGGNVLLEGLPGLGKTQLVKAVAKSLSLSFSRIQFTPDLMPSDATGTDIIVKMPDGNNGFSFQKGPLFSNLVLADEINRATPKTQSALLEAMQEQTVTAGGKTYLLPQPFFVLATQNSLEMEGTYPLPEAQMDRFMFKLQVPYPSKEELVWILSLTTGQTTVEPSPLFNADKLLAMRALAKQVPVSSAVSEYIAELLLKTQPTSTFATDMVKRYVRYGASPRGAQALISAARVYALLNDRYNVSFSDIHQLAPSALRHRIFLNFEALTDNVTPDDIISDLCNTVTAKTSK